MTENLPWLFVYLVDTVVIDALGSFHYLDKFEMEEVKDRTKGQVPSESKELVLAKVVRDILQLCKVTIFVSKCSLYDEEALPCLWPFPAAGVPRMPRDFMPALWSSIVSHVLLVYSVKGNAATEESCTRRGVVSLTVTHSEGKGSLRKLTVRVGTTMVYNDKGIFLDGSVHKA